MRVETNKDYWLFFAMGFIVFSPFSTILLIDFLHFPISCPELLIIPFYYLLNKHIKAIKFTTQDIILSGLIVLLLLAFGILYNRFPLEVMLSNCRPWFYLLIFYFTFKKCNTVKNEHLLYLSLGSLISWLIVSRLNFYTILRNSISDQGEMCTYGAMLLIPLFISLSVNAKRYKMLMIGLLTILPTCIYSGVRRLMVITALSILLSFLMSIIKSKKNSFMYLTIGCLFFSMGMLVMPFVMNLVEESSPEMYYRIFGRTISFLETGNSESEGDATRIRNILSFFYNCFEYIIPRGMISLRTKFDTSVGLFNDFPLYQLCWLFGLPITIIILIRFFAIAKKNFSKYLRKMDDTSCYSVSCLCIMFCMLFLDGTFIGFPEYTPITGMLLGIAVNNAKRI